MLLISGRRDDLNNVHWSFTQCGFTCLGVLILYARWGKDGLKYYVPRDILKTLHLSTERTNQLEFLAFLAIGTLVATVFADPQTARQAIAAGLGWTGMLASPNTPRKSS